MAAGDIELGQSSEGDGALTGYAQGVTVADPDNGTTAINEWIVDNEGGAYQEITALQLDTVGVAYIKGFFTGDAPFKGIVYDVIDPAIAALFALFVNNLSVNGKLDGGTFEPLEDSVPADGSFPTLTQAMLMNLQYNIEKVVTGTDVSIKKPDGTTELYGLSLNDPTNPTTITRDA